MKSFILKIFILAGIATLILSKFQHDTISENDYFIYLFKNENDQNFSDKAPFIFPSGTLQNDPEIIGMSPMNPKQENAFSFKSRLNNQ